MIHTKKFWIIVGIVVLAAIVIILWLWRTPSLPAMSPVGGVTTAAFGADAYRAALARAEVWEPDALLVSAAVSSQTETAWDYTFVSGQKSGTALIVIMNGTNVVSATEELWSGIGAALPAGIIQPDAALATMRGVPGYATSSIMSVELVYNSAAKQWYWGMKTATGITVTTQATP